MSVVEEVGVGVGVAIQALFETISAAKAKSKVVSFSKTLERLESTLKTVRPTINEILKSENSPSDAHCKFDELLKKMRELFDKYSEIKWWNVVEKWKVQKQIEEQDMNLQKISNLEMQVEQSLKLTKICNHLIPDDDATKAREASSSNAGTARDHEGNSFRPQFHYEKIKDERNQQTTRAIKFTF